MLRNTHIIAREGAEVVLQCSAYSETEAAGREYNYTWELNGLELRQETNQQLAINLTARSEGTYQCTARASPEISSTSQGLLVALPSEFVILYRGLLLHCVYNV